MDKDRTAICKIISAMLDNPDPCGIYPTSEAYDRLEQYIANVRRDISAYEKAISGCVIVPGETYDKLTGENEELKQLERQYSQTLGKLAQLCDVVINWADNTGIDMPDEVDQAATEIMEYVAAVRPCQH